MVEAVQEYKPGRPLSLVGCIRFVVNPIETKPILGQHRRLSSVLRPSRNDQLLVHPGLVRQTVRREMEIEPTEMVQRDRHLNSNPSWLLVPYWQLLDKINPLKSILERPQQLLIRIDFLFLA